VQISGMPNHLLSKMMMEATLQQARLEKFVIDISTKPGGSCGDALIILSNRDAAVRCARHFDGRRWGSVAVRALVITPEPAATVQETSSNFLNVDAPTFVPAFMLSAKAPEFIPGTMSAVTTLNEFSVISSASDASTADGESASSEDGDAAETASWQQ